MVKNTKQHGTVEFKDSVNILAELLDAAPGAITVHDLSGRFLYTNQKNLDLHGYEMKEFLSLDLHDLDVPESEALINERIEKIRKNGEATFTVHHFRKDGSIIPLEIFTKITKWGDQPVLLSIAADITERFENEKAVRESEEKYRNLMNEMQSGLALHEIILDENGIPVDYRFLDVNPAFERLTGLGKSDIVGRTMLEILPQTEKFWIERYGKVALTGESVEFEDYAASLDRYYSVVAYRPKENQFAVIVHEITERRKAEEKLKDNLALLRIAGEVTKLGGWNVNLEENRSYWSDVVAKIHEMPAGYAPMLEDGINFYAPEWRDKITKVFTDCATKGIPYNEKMEIITSTGKRVWIKTIGEAVRNEKGEIYKVHGAFQDITEEVEAETKLKESEKRYKALHNASFGGIVIHDRGLILECNQGLSDITGYSYDELIGMNGLLLIAEHARDKVIKNINEGYELPYESVGVRKNGEEYPLRLHARNIPFKGKSVRSTEFRDITEQKKSEEENIRLKNNFLQAFDSSPAAIAITSIEEGRFLAVNDSYTQIMEYEKDEIIGKKASDLKIYKDPEERNEIIKKLSVEKMVRNYELAVCTKTGRTKTLLLSMEPTIYDDEKTIISTFIDITDKKLAEEEKDKLQKELAQAQKMESIGRLAGGIAHDFNNMLSVIIGRVELALMKTGGESQILNELVEIQNAAERSAALTRQLLSFARKQVISPKILVVNENVEKILVLVKRLISENVELNWIPQKKVWNILMDPTQLDQIFTNLCINAKDAMPDGGKITIVAENATVDSVDENRPGLIPGDFVKISVEDNGHGMDKETASQIFEPFFTTKETGRGTGLGLATVFGIVKQNKGYIYCFSTEGVGTRFEIYFPKEEGGKVEESLAKPLCIKGEERTTILLVEDEPTILEMSRSMLQIFGYTVISAESPQEALKKSLEHKGGIDLLITDVIMPEMNGRELSKKIISHHPEIKCLFMSGYTAEIIAHQSVLDEDMNFIQKPFTMKTLGEKVKTVIGGK
jgi:PAS domain S-box-containing protein